MLLIATLTASNLILLADIYTILLNIQSISFVGCAKPTPAAAINGKLSAWAPTSALNASNAREG